MRRLFALALLIVGSACTIHPYSPPLGAPPLESSATVGAKKTAIQADAWVGGAVFGHTVSSTRLTLRRGLAEKLELSLAPSYTYVHDTDAGDSPAGIFGLRTQFKFAPTRHFSLAAGLGAGRSAGGSFFSPDVGIIAGFENRYLVPFWSGRLFMSVPMSKRTVHISSREGAPEGHEEDEDKPDFYSLEPRTSGGMLMAAGVRVPLSWDDDARFKPSLLCAFSVVGIRESSGGDVYMGGDCGLELAF